MQVCDRPGLGVLRLLEGRVAALLVDGVRVGAATGTLQRLEGPAILRAYAPLSTHGYGLAEALALGQSLGDLPLRLVLLGLELGPDWRVAPLPVTAVHTLIDAVVSTALDLLRATDSP